MMRTLGTFLMGTMVCASAAVLARQDDSKIEIKGGIEGKIKKVDAEAKKVTITTKGRDRTFTITDDTTFVGPRGGKVRRHLHDPRFHPGFPVIIVADGDNVEEVHLGFAKDADDSGQANTVQTPTRSGENKTNDVSKTKVGAATPPTGAGTRIGAASRPTSKLEDQDDEEEIPGHVKSYDQTRRVLVITLLNGKTRSFLLAQNVPVLVKGAATASRQGLRDPELKAGAFVSVITDEAGHKVKELKVVPASQVKPRKAG
jgi:hypothetical protein